MLWALCALGAWFSPWSWHVSDEVLFVDPVFRQGATDSYLDCGFRMPNWIPAVCCTVMGVSAWVVRRSCLWLHIGVLVYCVAHVAWYCISHYSMRQAHLGAGPWFVFVMCGLGLYVCSVEIGEAASRRRQHVNHAPSSRR